MVQLELSDLKLKLMGLLRENWSTDSNDSRNHGFNYTCSEFKAVKVKFTSF